MPARRLTRPGWILLGLVVLALGVWFLVPPVARRMDFFRVRRIEFVGIRNLTPKDLLAGAELPERMSVFDDFTRVGQAIGKVPGVLEVSVGRRLPGTLRLSIVEARPVALVRESGGMSLVDAQGSKLPFDPAVSAPDLPVIPRADTLVAGLLGRLRVLDPRLFNRTSAAWRRKDHVVLEVDGARVLFRPDATVEAMAAVNAVAADLARLGQSYEELDARYRQQIVVRGAERLGS